MSSNRVRTADWNSNSISIPITTSQNTPEKKTPLLFRQPKTFQEKVLCSAIFIVFILMMAFLAALCVISERWKVILSKLTFDYINDDIICQTEACRETAQKLISNIDPTTDPCKDFYQYACGGWMNKNPIPEGRKMVMTYYERKQEVEKIVVDLLNETISKKTKPKAVATIRNLFQKCIDTDTRNSIGVEPIVKLLRKMGGWPMIEGDKWNDRDYSWYQQTAETNRNLMLNIFIEISITAKSTNNKENMLLLIPGQAMFESYYDDIQNGTNINETERLFESIVDAAHLLGSESDTEKLKEEAQKLVLFEYSLFTDEIIAEVDKNNNDVTEITVGELDKTVKNVLVGNTDFTYKEFLNLHVKSDAPLTDDTSIYVFNEKYFANFPKYIYQTDLRVVANYMSYWIVHTFTAYVSDDLWNITLQGNRLTTDKFCKNIVTSFMPYAIGRIYANQYFPSLTKYHVNKMVEMIMLAYRSTLDQNTWMDKVTLRYSLMKLQNLQSIIGYPKWILDDQQLDEYYETVLDIEDEDFFSTILKLCVLVVDKRYEIWNKTVARVERSSTAPLTVNAFYIPRANLMNLPVGILGYPFYKFNRIDSINYGGIGTVIGHEISHAFDMIGRKFDQEGNYRNWWTKGTEKKFLAKAKCFIKQYETYVEEENPLWVDGKLTLSENIADNGAIRNAFKVWCSNMTDEYARGFRKFDVHSSNKLRVNIPLMNFREYAKAFKCNPGSPMNPRHKCILW